jgi:hypothetical protein
MRDIVRGQPRLVLSLLIALSVPAVASSAKADLIVNGGFETGDATGWTTTNLEVPYSGVTQYSLHTGGFIHAHSGTYYASLSDDRYAGIIPGHGRVAEFSQTVVTTAGLTYGLGFWAYIEPSALPGVVFQAYWDDILLLSIKDPKKNLLAPQNIRDQWVDYNFRVTGTGSDAIEFFSGNDPRYNGLDDVSLNASPTPLPGNFTLCGIAAAIVLRILHCRRRPPDPGMICHAVGILTNSATPGM